MSTELCKSREHPEVPSCIDWKAVKVRMQCKCTRSDLVRGDGLSPWLTTTEPRVPDRAHGVRVGRERIRKMYQC